MRIAFVINELIRPSEVFILNQITGLIDRGHSIDIFAYPPEVFGEPVHEEVLRYRLDRFFFPHPEVPSGKCLCRFQAGWATLLRLVCRPRITIRTIRHFRNRPEGFSYPEYRIALSLIRRSYDVVFCHYGPNGNFATFLRKVDPSTRLVTMFHGYDIRMALAGDRDMYRKLFDSADRLLANSRYTMDRLLELGADPSRVQVHPVGIDLNRFPSRDRVYRPQQEPIVILTVGRYVPEKGLEYGLKAIARLVLRFPNRILRYDIIGYGPEEDQLRRWIQELKLDGIVNLLGPKTHEKVIERLYSADIYLLPSVSEALGMSLLEAQAAGLPIVATETDGIPCAVVPGRSALLVPPADADALADKLGWLIENPQTWPDMAKSGREYVQAHFGIDRLNDALVALFEDLVGQKNPRNSARGVNSAAESADKTK